MRSKPAAKGSGKNVVSHANKRKDSNEKGAVIEDAPAGAGSIFKALRILERIVETSNPVSVAQLATTLGISKPTTHRIATFLEEFGFSRTRTRRTAFRRKPAAD